jgi:thiamine biosynthesis lipoprotein
MDEIRAVGAGRPGPSLDLVRCDFGAVELDARNQAVRLTPGMRIDLGGIAKGWIAQHAAERLATFATPCVVDAGGDMFMIGQPSDQGSWEVALEDPRDPEQVLAVLKVGPGAVATSSVMRRRWQQGGRVQHHLIDPRRAEPAKTDWLCVTAIAPEATVAEVFAKALLIAGPEQAPALARRRHDVEYFAVDREGQLWGSDKAREYMDVGIR